MDDAAAAQLQADFSDALLLVGKLTLEKAQLESKVAWQNGRLNELGEKIDALQTTEGGDKLNGD